VAEIRTGRRSKPSKSSPLPKTLNLDTYKFHALGDYAQMIKRFGTTDSYTTQVVRHKTFLHSNKSSVYMSQGERAHRMIKRYYASTNKHTGVEEQFGKHERRETLLRRQHESFLPLVENDAADSSPRCHHHMAYKPRRDNCFNLPSLLHTNQNDPAIKVEGIDTL
jgi:hypothetical protein